MKKKLKIRFVKFERAIAMQQLEIEGYFVESEHVLFSKYGVDFSQDAMWLASKTPVKESRIATKYFNSNTNRDEYLKKVVKWISEEQFATGGKLEIGKMCEVSSDGSCWARRRLLAILPEGFNERYICQSNLVDIGWIGCEYARPITSIQPTIDEDNNEIYTWEMEVEDEK